MVIFLNVCLWRLSLRSNLEGIDPEKLYLAIFICQYALCCCIVWPSFLFVDDCLQKFGQLAIIFWSNGLPLCQKIARTPMFLKTIYNSVSVVNSNTKWLKQKCVSQYESKNDSKTVANTLLCQHKLPRNPSTARTAVTSS